VLKTRQASGPDQKHQTMDLNISTLYQCIDRTVKSFLKKSSTPRMGKDDLVEFYRDYCLDRVYNRLKGFKDDDGCKFEAWLAVVVRNLCKDCHQSLAFKFMSKCEGYSGLTRAVASASEACSEEEKSDLLLSKLNLMKPREQQLLRLACLEGRSYKEISDQLGLKLSSLGRMIYRAKESLRTLVESDQDNYSQAA